MAIKWLLGQNDKNVLSVSYQMTVTRQIKPLLAFFSIGIAPLCAEETIGYNSHVRPILSDKCFLCHGPDETNNKAGFRLDTAEGAFASLKESKGKHGIVAGSLEKSEVWRRIISHDPKTVMPTPESNLKLTKKEKDIIAAWIKSGAEYEPHWSFVPLPDEVPEPKTNDNGWARNSIDKFIFKKLTENELKPSVEADPVRWLRRASLDLNGLPPSPSDIAAFETSLKDNPEKAYEKAVDAMLAKPEYGEHMAIDWLDAARYADTFGYHSDSTFTPWPYRDWVVKAFNEDLPYNDFVTWNLAGDLLPNPTREQRLATAFNRLHRITNEGGSNWLEFFVDGVSDRVHTTGTAFMALTMECTKCHDHKYDPITAKDYYSMYAFFNSINETGVYNHGAISPPPSLLLPTAKQEAALAEHHARATSLQHQIKALGTQLEPDFQQWKTTLPAKISLTDLAGHFTFNKSKDPLLNRVSSPKRPDIKDEKERKRFEATAKAKLPDAKFIDGPHGTGVELDGDTGVTIPYFFKKTRYTPFSINLWVKDPTRDKQTSALINRLFGHDVGYNGWALTLENGHLEARVFRSWPDNGIGIRSLKQIPKDKWAHISWTYDGSAHSSGLKLYLDGKEIETTITGDRLYKSAMTRTHRSGNFRIGAQFRGRGFKGGAIDELYVYDRAITPLEVAYHAGTFDGNLSEAPDKLLRPYFLATVSSNYRATLAKLNQAYKDITKREDSFLEIPTMVELDEPRPAWLLARGEFNAPRSDKNLVERDTIAVLPPFPKDAPRNRLGFAQWLTEPHHPLTSRVYVNRIWQQFFGRGIVGTTENFGLQGDLPTHPKLLDWLSRDFISKNWSTKQLCKTIVLSATYRQQSTMTPELVEKDISNLLLARGPAHRLSAEAIRDSALASSGLLSSRRGGRPVRPYDPLYNKKPKLHEVHSRSIYSYWRRTKPIANMTIFDRPSLEVCNVKRSRTNSAAQALVLLNDTQYVEAARNLATETLASDAKDDNSRITAAWLRVTSLKPLPKELEILTEILAEQRQYFTEKPENAGKLLKVGLKPLPKNFDPIETAAFTVVCQAIYNSDSAIWKR